MNPVLIDALTGFQGVTIRVCHPLPDASMRLLNTLGVTVQIDPDAPRCARDTQWTDRPNRRGCPQCARLDKETI